MADVTSWWLWDSPEGCPHRIAVDEAVWVRLHEAANESRVAGAETGGFLLGSVVVHPDGFTILIEDLLPGKNGLGTRDEFTLRAEDFISVREHGLAPGDSASQALQRVLGTGSREARHVTRPGQARFAKPRPTAGPGSATIPNVVVGWYHTHPGHGVFYSEPDQETHRERFEWPFQVGLVIDPEQERAGFFTWATWQQDVRGDWLGHTLSPTRLAQVKGTFHPWRRERASAGKPPFPARAAERLVALGLVGTGILAMAFSLVTNLQETDPPVARHAPLMPRGDRAFTGAFAVRLEPNDRFVSLDSGTSQPGFLGIALAKLPKPDGPEPRSGDQLALTSDARGQILLVPIERVRRLQGPEQGQVRLWLGSDARTVDPAWDLPGVVAAGAFEDKDRDQGSDRSSGDTGWYDVASGKRLEEGRQPAPGLYQEIGTDPRGRLVAGRRREVVQ